MTKNNKLDYSYIRNVNDLERYKRILQKKIKLRKQLLDKHIKDLSEDISADYIYRQSLKALKLDTGLLKLAPRIFNKNSKGKGFFVTLLSGLSAGIASLFFFKNKNNPSSDKENFIDNDNNKKPSPSSEEEQLFI